MGMYTHLALWVDLEFGPEDKKEEAVIRWLGGLDEEPDQLPDHPLFSCSRWRCLSGGSSYYFPGTSARGLAGHVSGSHCYRFTVVCDIKNYGNEIERFLDWLGPFLDPDDGHVGTYRYEESEKPCLVWQVGKRLELRRWG